MWILKNKYKTSDFIISDPNELSEEYQTMLKDECMDIMEKYFDII
tara:strand:- start:1819 stop:1953 length:135 start_codon:yes stop_codon:yes gene_type:complete